MSRCSVQKQTLHIVYHSLDTLVLVCSSFRNGKTSSNTKQSQKIQQGRIASVTQIYSTRQSRRHQSEAMDPNESILNGGASRDQETGT